jgi:phosphomannomutase
MATLVLLRVLSDEGVPLSELRKRYEPYAQSGEINFVVSDVPGAVAGVEDAFSDATLDLLDGLTVDIGDRWFNLRPSNTEPVLRLNVEAPTPLEVAELTGRVEAIIKEYT